MNEIPLTPNSFMQDSDCLLPTDNRLEIPTLDVELQPKNVGLPVLCYGEQRRSKNMRGAGILHFYTEDYRWKSIYEHPDKVMRHNPGAVVEANFSLFNDTPVAFGLQLLYKKRWLSRTLQNFGIPVFVDLNVSNKWYDMNLIGIPQGYGAFATRGYSDRIAALDYEYSIAERIAAGNLRFFLVYGGGSQVRDWCLAHPNAYYITPTIAIKNRQKALLRMQENITLIDDKDLRSAFHIEDLSASAINQIQYNSELINR